MIGMSYTEIYKVRKNGDVVFHDEIQNSWAGGMHVWNTLNIKYKHGDTFLDEF